MTRIIIKYRYLIIVLSVLIAMAGVALMPGMKTDPDMKHYIPDNLESKINTQLIEEEFGDQEIVMIVFRDSSILTSENLLAIKNIDRMLGRLGSVDKTISLFSIKRIYGEEGNMIVEPAVERIPRNSVEIDELKETLTSNPLAIGTVVSSDFTMAAIAVNLISGKPEKEILEEIESIVKENNAEAEIYYGGFPYIRKYIMNDVRRDGFILVPLALLIMLTFLWVAFREWKGMVLPFTMVVLAIAVSMGLVPLLGWNLSIISLLVPIMLIAVANDYGIHMFARYQELEHAGFKGEHSNLVSAVVRDLRKPILYTGLTTMAGVLGLLTHSIIPARQVGILAAAGVAFAVALTLFMLPAWLLTLKRTKERYRKENHRGRAIEKALTSIGRLVTRNPRRVLLFSLGITVIFAIAILRISVDGNEENFFPAKHPVKVSSSLINKNFGGSQSLSIMVEGDIKDPEILGIIDRWTEELGRAEGVGDAFSISSVVREMTKSIYDKDEKGYDKIPESRDAVAQLIEIYNLSGDPDDFEQLVNFDYSRAHLMVRFSDPETEIIRSVLKRIDTLSATDRLEVKKGGYGYINLQFADKIVQGQVYSLIFAVVIIIILLSIIFRSLKGGLISTIPILASVIFLLGFMGITGIALNSATALLSSIMIGVGVDYTIHFIWRYRTERKKRDANEAVKITLATTGRGIVFNAFSVMVGFSVLVFSGFTSIRFFGYLILISIGVCLVSALFIIPSLLLVYKPGFAEPDRVRIVNKNLIGKHMKRAIAFLLLVLISFVMKGQDKAEEIMNRSRDNMKVESFEAVSSLKITDSKGRVRERTNITASRSYSDGTEKRLIKFLTPAEVKGTAMLIFDHDIGDDDMWIYLPALNRTRRIVSGDKGKSFMGSEFSNSDMSSPPVDDFKHTIVKEDNNEWVIESTPATTDKEDEYGYAKKVSYIDKSDYLVRKMEFYNFDIELFKIIVMEDYLKVGDNRFLVKHMSASNIVNNRTSEIVMSEVRIGAQISDDLFTLSNLER